MSEIELPRRQFTIEEVKQQSAVLVINSVDFVYEVFAQQVRRGLVPDVIEENVPTKFVEMRQEQVKENGMQLIRDYITWFRQSPRAEVADVIKSISRAKVREDLFTAIMNNRKSEVEFSDVVTQHDLIRDKLHRSKSFRDDWLLHNEERIVRIEGDEFIVEDKLWKKENMGEFSNQVRKVLDDLDIDRKVREDTRRQRRMRKLLRMANMTPVPIINASITGRPRPVLDRIN